MSKAYFPDNFQTSLETKYTVTIFRVTCPNNITSYTVNLRYLSDKMLKGERLDKGERAVAGAALSHLIDIHKSQK